MKLEDSIEGIVYINILHDDISLLKEPVCMMDDDRPIKSYTDLCLMSTLDESL